MEKLTGISASPGIAIGKVLLFVESNLPMPEYTIGDSEVNREIRRYKEALDVAEQELVKLKDDVENIAEIKDKRFIDAHILMLKDPLFTRQVQSKVKDDLKNVEHILHSLISDMIEKFGAMDDEYLRERTTDLHDVSKRVLSKLQKHDRMVLSSLEPDTVVVANDLLPSDTLHIDRDNVSGMVMNAGGRTSHTAILARSFEIPAVLGLRRITSMVRNGDQIIVDGSRGVVIVRPDEATLIEYKERSSAYKVRELQMVALNRLPAETKDGKLLFIKGNIETPEEVEHVRHHNADGVGLFRSEFLFFEKEMPTEEEQFNAYKHVLEKMEKKPVTIRTLDLGGDKILPGAYEIEKNPLLGWRAVRFCLGNPDIFRTQIRALLRASLYGSLRIMFPLISGHIELYRVLEFVKEVKADLREKKIPFAEDVPLGAMIEVPSAALTSDIIAQSVDFFSIGTNDLIQYTTAVDRGNEKVAYLYDPAHLGVLRLIKMTIDNAHKRGIQVGMCGEMAGDPFAAVFLVGIGLDEFSMSALSVPLIKRIIRSISHLEAEEIAGKVMDMRRDREINEYIISWMHERFDFLRE